MLLVDRATTKYGRNKESVSTVLELPTNLVAVFDVSVKTQVLGDIVQELARLIGDLSKTDKEAFLSQTYVQADISGIS